MNKWKSMQWSVAVLISFFMLFSAYISGSRVVEFAQMGFPNYFRIELTVAKIIGALVLLVPQTPARIREWVYVSFSIVLISAAIAKFHSGYPATQVTEPLIVLTIMTSALFFLGRLHRT